MLHQHVGERLELVARIGGAGRVRRRVEQEPFGLRRDRALERLGADLEAVLHGADHRHRRAAGEQHHVGIAHPIRRRDDHLVARIERRHERVVEHLLAAGADRDLRGLVVEAVLALELARDRFLELGEPVDLRCTSTPCRPWIALIAACLMLSGVSKSGSPAPRPMTSRPAAFSARALSVTAIVGDGLMRLSCSARKAIDVSFSVACVEGRPSPKAPARVRQGQVAIRSAEFEPSVAALRALAPFSGVTAT